MNDMQGMLSGATRSLNDAPFPATAKSAAYLVGSNGLSYVLPSDGGESVDIMSIHIDVDQV